MFWGEEDSRFQNLPTEMIVEVLNVVDVKGKKKARLVCRRWRCILDHPNSGLICFKKRSGKTSDDSLKYLLKSQIHIQNLDLAGIKMTWPVMTKSRNKFPPIQKIGLHSGNSEQTVTTILQYGCTQQTESLTLGNDCFSHVRPYILTRLLSSIEWNQFTELSFVVIPDIADSLASKYDWSKTLKKSRKNHAAGIELILKEATVPNLRILRLDIFSYEENEISTGIIKLMSKFVDFIERHSQTLKELGLYISFNSVFPNIPAPLFSPDQQETVADNLKLESLEIRASHFEILVHIVPPFVWATDTLTDLIWRPTWDSTWYTRRFVRPRTPNPIESLIHRNRNTLSDVTTTLNDWHLNNDPIQISWLESCPALSELTIKYCHTISNVQVQLPTLRKLDLRSFMRIESFKDISTWIARSFQNLENLQVSVWTGAMEEDIQLAWLDKLLDLPRLRHIWFRFSRPHSHLNEKTLIRRFCEGKARLLFKTARQREVDDQFFHDQAFVIDILPLQNTN